MTNLTNILEIGAGWLVTFLLPFALILTAVRLMLTPVWVNIEYRTPFFPEDPYGFSLSERLKWAEISVDYLLNDEEIEWLAEQKLSDGTPLYNERELGHMVDVKNVVKISLQVWIVSLIGLGLIGTWAAFGGWFDKFQVFLTRGGWLTIGLVGAVLLFVLIAFGVFFVFFHEVFFDPGTWTFLYSDSLIRLFPERFWRDAFLWIGAITFLEALWIISLTKQAN